MRCTPSRRAVLCADVEQRDDVPIHIRQDDLELRLFSSIMTIGTPQDVTLQGLRVETFFPADDPSECSWRRVTGDE